MKRRLTRASTCGLALVAAMAVGASPAAAAKKKPKTRTITTTVPGAFNQCQNLSVPITDFSTNRIQFTVPSPTGADPAAGTVTRVNSVGIRATHTSTADLTILLISPGGQATPLILSRGGANLGSGAANCGGTLTTLSDTATIPIRNGVAPYAGTFLPEAPLSAFTGGAASGIWTLLVSDIFLADVGTVHAASLNLTFSHTVKQVVKRKNKKKKKKKK